MNDLEQIPYDAVVRHDAVPYSQWRRTLKPRYGIVWRDIVLGFAALVIVIAAAANIPMQPLLLFLAGSLLAALLTGFTLAYLALFLHEAGHFNLHSNKKKNDQITDYSLGILFGLSIKSYRKIHWQHHLHLGTTADTEISYHNALTASFLLESFTGIHLLRVMKQKNSDTGLTPEMKQKSIRMLIAGALFNGGLLLLLAALGAWGALIAWTLGMLLFFPFFATVRQLLEHRHDLAAAEVNYREQAHGRFTRLFGSGVFSRIFGGAGFNKHMIHHWDPQVSYTRLADVEHFLLQSEATRTLVQQSRTGYFKTFKKLLLSRS